jgi:hypothetical protein
MASNLLMASALESTERSSLMSALAKIDPGYGK